MSSKKKLIISLSVAAAVLLCAIIAIVAVFAAGQQAVQTGFTVTFTASDIDVTVAASSKTEKGTSVEIGSVTFNAADGQKTESLNPSKGFDLTREDTYVDITYTITVNGAKDCKVLLANALYAGDTDNGFAITIKDGTGTDIKSALTTDGKVISNETPLTIVVRIAIPENVKDDASLNMTLNFTLSAYTAPSDGE